MRDIGINRELDGQNTSILCHKSSGNPIQITIASGIVAHTIGAISVLHIERGWTTRAQNDARVGEPSFRNSLLTLRVFRGTPQITGENSICHGDTGTRREKGGDKILDGRVLDNAD